MFYPLVSVIIPVYQAEKFLTECVESVRKQDYSELEIVLVNDGSTDRSNQMCEELAAADPRIRVIHQNNKGSGAARNAGIKEATGKYLLFLDADDKLDDSSAIRSLAARAEREQADIVIGTYRRWRANGEKVKCCSNLEKENPDSAEFRFHGFFQKGTLATVYKGNIIKNLIMDCQSYTKYRPNETTGGIFVSWRRKEELSTGA